MTQLSQFEQIELRLEALKRRRRFIGFLRALFIILAVSIVSLTGTILLLSVFSPTPVVVTIVRLLILFCALFGSSLMVAKTLRQTATALSNARYWETHQPELKDSLIAFVEFREKLKDGSFIGDKESLDGLASWVLEKIANTDVSQITPLRNTRPNAMALAFALVALATALSVFPTSLSRGWSELLGTARMTDGIETGPVVGDVTIIIDPPAYTELQRRLIPNSNGNLTLLPGSRLTVKATSIEAISGAFILYGDQEITAKVINQRQIEVSFKVFEGNDWRFGVRALKGRNVIEAIPRRLTIKADGPPNAEMIAPATDLELEDVGAVPVEFSGGDDFGISRVVIRIALADDDENATRVEQSGYTGKRVRGADEIDLSVIDAQPGDRIGVAIEMYDNRTIGGPQKATSPVRYITIKSKEFEHYRITEALHALIDVLLANLADRLELEYEDGTKSFEQRYVNMTNQTGEVLKSLEKVLARMESDPLSGEDLILGLRKRTQALKDRFKFESSKRLVVTLNDNAGKTALLKLNQTMSEPLEQLVLYVEALVSRLGLEDIAEMTRRIKAAKQRLKDLVSAYKKKPSPGLKSRILRNIKRLKERMRGLRERMAKLRQKLPDEFLNIDGLKNGKIGENLQNTSQQLDSLEKMVQEDRLDEALEALEEMEDTLEQLSNALDEDMQSLHEQTNPQLQKALSELMDNARDLMKQQQRVSEATSFLSEQEQKQREEMLKSALKDKLDEIKQLAEALKKDAAALGNGDLPAFANDAVVELETRVDELLRSLANARLDGALRAAREARPPIYSLNRFVRFGQRKDEQSKVVAENAQSLNDQIIKKLESLLDQARQQARMRQQANQPQQGTSLKTQQEQLQQAAKRLRQKMSEQASQIPGLQGEPMQSMDGAQQAMQRATKSLGKQQAGHAVPSQSEAVSQLQKLMKGLKQASKPQRKRGKGQRGQRDGRNVKQDKVRIPGADEHDAPAEFREELMEAMKDKAPAEFKESVKRYYESLVK
ncbi:MAG: DUF4175 family protein [Bradymonadia bacterium]